MKKLHNFLFIIILLSCQALTAEGNHWFSIEMISVDVNASENYLSDESENEKVDKSEVIQQEIDSLKADRKRAWKNRYRKNSIRIDGFGKALLLGLSYDRILFHTERLDFHINGGVGFLGSGIKFQSFNVSGYLEVKKFRIHPIVGLGYHYNYNQWNDGEFRINNAYGGLIGGQFKLSKNWNMQFHVLPFCLTHENGRHELGWTGNGRHTVMTESFSMYGGLNIGYQF
jgi:hypothetical protein